MMRMNPSMRRKLPTFESNVEKSIASLHKCRFLSLPDFNRCVWLELPDESFRVDASIIYSAHLGKNPVWRGFYASQLKKWMKYFKLHEDILVVRYEEFLENKGEVVNQVLDFVGALAFNMSDSVLHQDYSPQTKMRSNYRQPLPIVLSNETRAALMRLYRSANDELADFVGEGFRGVWD
jgi:hypothetical protein